MNSEREWDDFRFREKTAAGTTKWLPLKPDLKIYIFIVDRNVQLFYFILLLKHLNIQIVDVY